MPPKHRDGDVVFSISGTWISWAHTIAAFSAFIGAFIVGVALHYHKIVQNEHYGYPDEWFPSVSATIGDRYPERSVFQVFIAITSGPRFALVALWYLLTTRPNSTLPKFVAYTGIFRTLTCGGWTYVTSTDDHDWHDIFMISYLVATLPWTLGCIALSPPNPASIRYRKIFAGLFFATLVPLIYFFIQHKVHRVAGAYTIYAFFEWSLVLLDVAFDSVTALDFASLELVVKDVQGLSRRDQKRVADSVLDEKKGKDVGQVFGKGFSWNEALDAVADVFNGYVFWTTLTSLGLLVWYFPLWYMGLSGYEAMILASVSPFLFAIPPVRTLVMNHLQIVHVLAVLVGTSAWLFQPPDQRLFVIGGGVFLGCLAWTGSFYADRSQPFRLEARAIAFGMGLILSCVSKYAYQTNNPMWPTLKREDGGLHWSGLILAVLAALRSTRGIGSATAVSGPLSSKQGGYSFLSALGIAGLFFNMQSLFSDSSTVISWGWEGFPVRGPLAVPHGSFVIAALSAGTAFGVFYPRIASSWTAFGVGSIGAAMLVLYSHWTGFLGALIIGFYTMAVSPALIASAVRTGAALTFGVAFLVYNFLLLFHVWVVAYAFVPAGHLVRERTDWVVTTTMVFIAAGVFSAQSTSTSTKSPRKPANPAAQRTRSYYMYILLGLQLLSASISFLRFPTYDYAPAHPEANLITAGIWTVHFAIDNPGWEATYRMEKLISELELDVLGLLESDTQRIIMGNRDFTQILAEDLGYYVDYGPGPNKHTWGAALISKFPILNSTHHLLPSPVGELAPAIHATIDAYGTEVDVFVFHSGQEEDPEDRRLQSEYLADLMGRSGTRPAILLSYLVITPGQGNYNTYVSEKSGMRDVDASDWDRWCEYVLYKNIRRSGYARVSRDSITDTELQVAKFVVGQPAAEADQRIGEELVPEALRFPALFRGEGVRGHRYHVFDEPRYFS